jgi:phytanoyl-CoA hydroxylase
LNEDSECFERLLTDPRIIEILQAIWPGDQVFPGKGASMFDKPSVSSGDTPPHQDNTFQCWDPPFALSATVAIDESTPGNGPLSCQKGTHLLGMLPHRFSGTVGFSRVLVDPLDEAKYPNIQLCMKPGDMALHHILSVHSANVNRSGLPRRQIGISYISSRTRRDEAAYAQYQKDLDALHTHRNLV